MFQVVDTFLQIRQRLRDVKEGEDGWVTATLEFQANDTALIELLNQLQQEAVIAEFRRGDVRVYAPNFGESGPLTLKIDLGHLPGYFETYQALIERFPDAEPDEYRVWQSNPEVEAGYKAAVELLTVLKMKAEVWDNTRQRFFLVDQQAIEISLIYDATQTVSLPEIVPAVVRFLDSQHLDSDTRWAFFRKASGRTLRDVSSEKRLGFLFEQLKNVFDRTQEDYSLYLERFSFEDLLKNFDEKRLKFVGDLNQVLASIQTSLIAVPIGFFLVAEKFEPASGLTGKNLVLAVGGLIFVGLVFLLAANQGKTLLGVKTAIDTFEDEQKKKITEASARLGNLLADTRGQYARVRLLLIAVRILLVLFATILLAALILCSAPSLQRYLPYVSKQPEKNAGRVSSSEATSLPDSLSSGAVFVESASAS
jgi:hypothetical protein